MVLMVVDDVTDFDGDGEFFERFSKVLTKIFGREKNKKKMKLKNLREFDSKVKNC